MGLLIRRVQEIYTWMRTRHVIYTKMHHEAKRTMRVHPRTQLTVCVIELHDIPRGTAPMPDCGVD